MARARHEHCSPTVKLDRLRYAARSVHKAIQKEAVSNKIVPDGVSGIACDGIYIICKNKINLSVKDALL